MRGMCGCNFHFHGYVIIWRRINQSFDLNIPINDSRNIIMFKTALKMKLERAHSPRRRAAFQRRVFSFGFISFKLNDLIAQQLLYSSENGSSLRAQSGFQWHANKHTNYEPESNKKNPLKIDGKIFCTNPLQTSVLAMKLKYRQKHSLFRLISVVTGWEAVNWGRLFQPIPTSYNNGKEVDYKTQNNCLNGVCWKFPKEMARIKGNRFRQMVFIVFDNNVQVYSQEIGRKWFLMWWLAVRLPNANYFAIKAICSGVVSGVSQSFPCELLIPVLGAGATFNCKMSHCFGSNGPD